MRLKKLTKILNLIILISLSVVKNILLSGTITWLNISGKQFGKYIMNL